MKATRRGWLATILGALAVVPLLRRRASARPAAAAPPRKRPFWIGHF